MTTSLTNHYQAYIADTITLAKTIVIKSDEVAEAINAHVRLYSGDVDDFDPYSWKYYQNIAGEYHFSDEPMEVVSLDTLQKIAFTKENLVRHRGTAAGYVYGSRHYLELVSRFPKQEMLILGILYPVDRVAAINAKNGQILQILPGLVEENEYTFVLDLQKWIDGYKLRWVNQQYSVSDNMYTTATLGVMYAMLLPAILLLRKTKCKTNEAHSYHVRQYLLSHGLQDIDLDHLTLKQSLWLYRNIDYLERHSGLATNFETLIEHILTERLIPLADYTMRHDVSGMPDNLYPDLTFRRKALNLGYSVNALDNISLQQLLDKEDPFARDNKKMKEDLLPVIRSDMENSRSNVLITKVLESIMVDYTNSEYYKLEDILLNHWLYYAANNLYVAAMQVLQPITGERVPMRSKDAFCVMYYFYCKSMGIDLDVVPTLTALRVQRLQVPTVEEMMKVVEARLVSRELAAFSRSLNPHIEQMISISEFNTVCHEIFLAANKQRDLSAFQEHPDARAYVQNMNQRMYTDAVCQLSPTNETYDQLFARLNFQTDGLEQENFISIWKEITADMTGASLSTTKSVKDMQAAMIRIMKQLSSYTVQYLADINPGGIISLDSPAVRVGDAIQKNANTFFLHDMVIGIQSGSQHSYATINYNINGCRLKGWAYTMTKTVFGLELPNLIHHDEGRDETTFLHDAATIGVKFAPVSAPTNAPTFPMPGAEAFMALPADVRKALQQQWDERV